ncbi:H/ACA RNA-protein complex component Gar1 [Halovivax asiaticus JCM 14624]|uniref:H/ACA RNA-protein complex component Gar1 n=1 Tax=Halovivax asiaticus JCM 14624 TaxID=1227490 RepID=M0BT41_9EURY|nr:Gar1/Naf1 family protein [Halovivax asiaticus]ELZ13538.1 H/ACA RNA-protein complex component Gar1 [Halovivax asiaticus JCM 14624]
MRRAGSVVEVAQGLLVCRATDDIDIGTPVLDDSLTSVGRVVDVFGPVAEPYFAVTPSSSVHPPTLVGERIYVK